MTLKLSAKKREIVGKKVAAIRSQGGIPAVLYGHSLDNINLELSVSEFEKVFAAAGENTIIDLDIAGGSGVKVLIHDVQNDPVKNRFQHVDLHQIRMDEKIHTHVPIKFIGESRLVKEENGMFIHNISEIEIECLPGSLIHELDVDISVLDSFDDAIAIKDLKLPDGLEIIGHEPDDVIALVTHHREEKEETPVVAPEAVVAAEGEKAEAGKEEAKK